MTLLLCDPEQFPKLFEEWQTKTNLDEVDYATSRLLPLLSRRLREASLVTDITSRIHGVHKLAWVKNQRLLEAIGRVIPLLEAEGISVLILKGVPLLLNVYNDVGARFLGDADVLIHPKNLRKTLEIMLTAGWKLSSPRFPKYDRFSDESLARITKEMTFVNAQGLEIDIHWRLFDIETTGQTLASFETLWERSIPIPFKDKTYRTLSPEDLLLHVIVHGAEGNVHRTLRWVVDAVSIIKALPLNWEKLLEEIRTSGWIVELQLAFSFLQQHQLIAVPESFLQALFAIPFSQKQARHYYQKANTPHAWWGSFPRLWSVYWQHEAKRSFPSSFFDFIEYLSLAWGFERKQDLIPFIFGKYRERVNHHFRPSHR